MIAQTLSQLGTTPAGIERPSALDSPPGRFADAPFYAETLTLLRSVRDHDFDTLAALCDDDFGIVDVDPSGNARPIRDRAASFECVATIIWKRTADGWRESRWHASVISSDVPAELLAGVAA